jgi:hypothetical protein
MIAKVAKKAYLSLIAFTPYRGPASGKNTATGGGDVSQAYRWLKKKLLMIDNQ